MPDTPMRGGIPTRPRAPREVLPEPVRPIPPQCLSWRVGHNVPADGGTALEVRIPCSGIVSSATFFADGIDQPEGTRIMAALWHRPAGEATPVLVRTVEIASGVTSLIPGAIPVQAWDHVCIRLHTHTTQGDHADADATLYDCYVALDLHR